MDSRLTYSQMQSAQTCLRMSYFEYVLGLRPIEDAKALRIGSAIHAGIDAKAKGASNEAAIDTSMLPYLEVPCLLPENPLQYEAAMVQALLTGYFWRWSEIDATIKIIASEISFDIPIVNPATGKSARIFTLAGKIDALVNVFTADAIKETKTTSENIEADTDFWKRLRIDAQISVYFMAAPGLAPMFEPKSIWYDVIRKPTIKPCQIPVLDADGLKVVLDQNQERVLLANGKPRQSADKEKRYELLTRSETPVEWQDRLLADIYARPDYYYARKEIARLESDIAEAQQDIWSIAHVIQYCQLQSHWPKNTRACLRMGKCKYFDKVCSAGGYALGDPPPDGFELVTNTHEELDNG